MKADSHATEVFIQCQDNTGTVTTLSAQQPNEIDLGQVRTCYMENIGNSCSSGVFFWGADRDLSAAHLYTGMFCLSLIMFVFDP